MQQNENCRPRWWDYLKSAAFKNNRSVIKTTFWSLQALLMWRQQEFLCREFAAKQHHHTLRRSLCSLPPWICTSGCKIKRGSLPASWRESRFESHLKDDYGTPQWLADHSSTCLRDISIGAVSLHPKSVIWVMVAVKICWLICRTQISLVSALVLT